MSCASGDHCITCSDEGIPMRIVGLLGDGLARCADDSGSESDVMVDLIHPVRVGARIVVHAGTALRVTESPEALP